MCPHCQAPEVDQEELDGSILDELAAEEVHSARLLRKLRRTEAAAELELCRDPPDPSPRVTWDRSARRWFGLACAVGIVIALLLGYIAYKLEMTHRQPPPDHPEQESNPARASSDDATRSNSVN